MHGNGSGCDLVKQMQHEVNFQTVWIMLDHVKHVEGWTTLTYHMYDFFYYKVMTITTCDMYSKDIEVQCVMWQNLDKVMANNGVPNPNFKGFMAYSAQANWNIVQIVYGSGDPSESMVDKK